MFLGWVFNVLFLAFVQEFTAVNKYKRLFWLLQFCVLGMVVSFPLQGYGVFSIVFSGLHTVTAVWFIVLFFRETRQQRSLAIMFARTALLFFVLSALGPFGLGYFKASGLQHTDWYRFSLYFYLHFQYNGFFFFGILSLLFRLLEHILPENFLRSIRYAGYVLIISCVLAYSLSLLWAQPHQMFNWIGLLAALAQMTAFLLMMKPVRIAWMAIRNTLSPLVRFLFQISLVALLAKLLLQIVSAHPTVALFAEAFRSVVIAYLHLMLVGVITLFLVGWLIHKRILTNMFWPVTFLLTGFLGSQILLVLLPWWSDLAVGVPVSVYNNALFVFTFFMVCGVGIMFRASWTKDT